MAKVSAVLSAGLLATTILPHIMIILRCVRFEEKAMALALQLTFVGILPFVPFKIIYNIVASEEKYVFIYYCSLFTILKYSNKTTSKIFKVVSVLSDALCKYSNGDRCLFHSEYFGTFLSIATISLLAIAALLNLSLVFWVKNLEIYQDNKEYGEDNPEESDHEREIQIDIEERSITRSIGGNREQSETNV